MGGGTSGDTVNVNTSSNFTFKKTKTLATLGTGTITLTSKDATIDERLNRDSQITNKDLFNASQETGIDLSVDTRLLSESGRDKIAEELERVAEDIQDMPVVGQTLTYQTKDGQEVLLENGKLYKYNSEGKKEELPKGNYVVYKSGMLNNAEDTKQGYQELTDGTVLRNYENVILVNNPTHLFGVADALESAVGYIGIPTGNAFQTQEFNEATNELGTILNLTHSQANIVEKNSNRLHFGEELSNIHTLSLASPEYAGTGAGEGNTLYNASTGAGANFIGGFNNEGDPVSLLGFNNRENAPTELIKKFETNNEHPVEDYAPHLEKPEIKTKIQDLLNLPKD